MHSLQTRKRTRKKTDGTGDPKHQILYSEIDKMPSIHRKKKNGRELARALARQITDLLLFLPPKSRGERTSDQVGGCASGGKVDVGGKTGSDHQQERNKKKKTANTNIVMRFQRAIAEKKISTKAEFETDQAKKKKLRKNSTRLCNKRAERSTGISVTPRSRQLAVARAVGGVVGVHFSGKSAMAGNSRRPNRPRKPTKFRIFRRF